jgi:hypothetical protein
MTQTDLPGLVSQDSADGRSPPPAPPTSGDVHRSQAYHLNRRPESTGYIRWGPRAIRTYFARQTPPIHGALFGDRGTGRVGAHKGRGGRLSSQSAVNDTPPTA